MSTYNLHTKYSNYTAQDLLNDESFIDHHLHLGEAAGRETAGQAAI